MTTHAELASHIQGSSMGRWHPAYVLAGLILAHVGLWNAGIPLGDEGVHILQALRIIYGEIASFNPYYLAYAALLTTIAPEPAVAHLVMRFMLSVGSTVGLYLVLRSFRVISPLGATLATLAWVGAALCTPYTQSGNNSLLCLTLVLPALAWLLRRPSWASICGFALAALVAANVRPEYFAPLILVPAGGVFLIRARGASGRPVDRPALGRVGARLLIGALITAALATAFRPEVPGASLQTYLLQGLGQCYGDYYRRLHPDERFNPMTEYQDVLDRVFWQPQDLH